MKGSQLFVNSDKKHPIRNTFIGVCTGAIGGVAAGAITTNNLLSQQLSETDRRNLCHDLLVKSKENPNVKIEKINMKLIDYILIGKHPITNRELLAKKYLQKMYETGKFPKRLEKSSHCLISPNEYSINEVINVGKFVKKVEFMTNAERLLKTIKGRQYGLIGAAVGGTLALVGTYFRKNNS